MNFYQKTSTKKSLVKEDEVRREARVEQSVFPLNHITMTLPPSDQSPAAVALKSASVSGVSQKRKSSTVVSKTASVAAKFPKIPDRKKKFVSTVLYEVSRPCQDIRGKTFAVYPGERVKFIRYCEGGVEVMNQFEVSGVIPEDALDPTKVPRLCPCRNVHIFKEEAYLNHQVKEHYWLALQNYLKECLNTPDGSQQGQQLLACPVENCQEIRVSLRKFRA